MDLSFGPEYEEFRQTVRSFIAEHGEKSPRNAALRSPEALQWQKMLIENGYTRPHHSERIRGLRRHAKYAAQPDHRRRIR